ncbi:Vps5 C terminal like-domain-containing protein [Suillus subaureus]|uniref:Vps5 C terminal like-domain-containing protein n=1 Tax=Suillus subaureus TaxID=48587 RepID=A0A9P7E9X5_9AGAM|nr:Vps5 C terminal like-domain-containing protein [Suillus subaureus]KAG1815636.1 Vps5 C terminal like-domain-containing protein [Suillus subaureus]
MFDPLSSTSSIFANGSTDTSPPWPTTPHEPNSPIPHLRRASPSSPSPVSVQKAETDGLYGREPKIYGQPEPGLVSPQTTVGSNGTKYEKMEPYLRVRITGMDRNRRDILFKLDAQTTLSNFTGTTYRNVSRSYLEFQQFYEALINNCPHTIIPALPLAQTSAPTDEEDDRLVRIMLQRWLTRICEDPIVIHDEELRSFIESDFGYQPTPRPRRKTGSGFGLIRRGVPDEDEVLQRARFELTKLETQFFDAAKAIDKLAITRKSLAAAHAEMGNKLINVATTESHPPLGHALQKLGRAWHTLTDLDQAQAISECVVIGDTLGYQGLNARSAKEALLQRAGVLEEYQAAVKSTISKRRNIERLKASSNIRPERVDEALEDIEEANKYEQVLAQRANNISQNLHRAMDTHKRTVADDITAALIEHARSSIMYERQLLRELEALRTDVNNANQKVAPPNPNGIPKPSVILPLEDDTLPTHTRATPPPRETGPPLGGRFVDGTQSMFVNPSSPSPLGPPVAASASSLLPQGPLGGTIHSPVPSSATHPLAGFAQSPLASNAPVRPASTQQAVDPLGMFAPTNMSQSVRVHPSRPRLDARVAASKLANMF